MYILVCLRHARRYALANRCRGESTFFKNDSVKCEKSNSFHTYAKSKNILRTRAERQEKIKEKPRS